MPASSQKPDKFKVDRLPSVTLQIQQLVEKAKRLGMGRQLLDVLESIVEKLETNPMDWGDPEYATKHPGGVVLHGGSLSPYCPLRGLRARAGRLHSGYPRLSTSCFGIVHGRIQGQIARSASSDEIRSMTV